MKFSDIFWKTWKVRTAVKIQETIESVVVKSINKSRLNANLPEILKEIYINNSNFGSFLEKQRTIIIIEKELARLPIANDFTDNEKQEIKNELNRILNFLNQQ
jgi:hypothetical protein